MKTHLFITSLIFFAQSSLANFESYDQIVDKLSNYKKEAKRELPRNSSLNTHSMAHIGLGVSQTFYDTSRSDLGDGRVQNQGGLTINLGVDLFSPEWSLEGSFANFGRGNSETMDTRLREFSLRGFYKPQISQNWNMRLGLGMSARFLEVTSPQGTASYDTPSGIFTLGLDKFINSFVSVGADINLKTAMVADTIDNNSVDLTLRIDTHF